MTVRIQFQLRDEVAERLLELAREAGVSRQEVVQRFIMSGYNVLQPSPTPDGTPRPLAPHRGS